MENLILKYLAKGMTQAEISDALKKKGIWPNSLSMVEKLLKDIKTKYKAKTSFHLAVILCKKGEL